MSNSANKERSLLILSAWLAAFFAIMSIVFGLMLGSLVIAFDGFYSLVSVALTLLSVLAVRIVDAPRDQAFPFGRAIIEPLVLIVKGSVIFLLCAYAFYGAIVSLFEGGRIIDVNISLLIGVINTVGCFVIFTYLTRASKGVDSSLLHAENAQWKMDGYLSLAVLIGFVISALLQSSPLAPWARYADPVMMLLVSCYFLRMPIEMVSQAVREILHMKADESLEKQVDKCVHSLDGKSPVQFRLAGLTKVGRELHIQLELDDLKTQPGLQLQHIQKAQLAVEKELDRLPFRAQLNLALT
ncbi:cation diffusion facilitator family transporter [Motilimonas eburnea]|uniref:cation diffusion facilitator family transporter n=1 Tax=Motilimonas eburnea TaxID=1737488 RepID=UPI001E375DEB|nr:cation diffusion facilitator family transporter [Motilimonas eburnea]MCE2571069.1 cation diffusion facilitator family transporter [Motilimonas eburnea]